MKEAVSALLETTLYAAVLTGAILVFRLAFKKHASARLQYLCWMLLLLRLMLPVTFESGVHADAFFSAPVPDAARGGGALDAQDAPVSQPAMPPSPRGSAAFSLPSGETAENASYEAAQLPKKAADPYAAAFYAWCGGIALSFAWFVFVRARFSHRVLRAAYPAPGAAAPLYEACARLAGVKNPPRLMVTREALSPSLALYRGKAAVLLPEPLLEDAPALRYALLHELSHFKRGDHFAILLCALLRCIHWFNPAVWLGFSAMRSDMEAACDARVLALVEPEEKRDYLLTLLSLFTKARRPVLGMAQFQTKRLAQKRVADAFRTPRTGGAARLLAAASCAVLLFSCFTTACQPTPDKDVVINKGEGTLENAISGTPAPVNTAVPADETPVPVLWTDSAESASGKVKLVVNAEIITPNVSAYPVYRIDPCADFTQEFVTAVHREILGGCRLVNYFKEMTRGEAEEAYYAAAKRLAEFEEKGVDALSVIADGRTPEEQVVWEIEYAKQEMKNYAELMKTAPETVPDAYIEPDAYLKDDYGGYGFLAVPEYGGDYGRRFFSLSNGTDGSRGHDQDGRLSVHIGAQYVGPVAYDATREDWFNSASGGGDANFGVLEKKIAMTPQEAEAAVFDILARVGFPGTVRVAKSGVYGLHNTDDSDGRPENNYAYLYTLEPVIDGIPVFSNVYRKETDPYETAYYYRDESITVAVNDTGIHEFTVEGYFTLSEPLNANVELMDLEAIKERVIAQLLLENAYWEENSETAEKMEVYVMRMELGYARTVTKDDPAGQMLIPVWNVYCAYKIGDEEMSETRDFPAVSINAIDGSRM